MTEGWLYDGQTAVRRPVRVERAGEGWTLILADSEEESAFDPASVHHLESRGDAEIYGRTGEAGWRLRLPKPIDPDLAAALPRAQVYGRWIDRFGLPRTVGIGIAASGALLFLGYQLPALAAPLIPFSWEQKFGEALLGDLDARVCSGREGQQALDRITAQLAGNPGKYKVRIADLPMVNAVALPGGNIVIFKPLLTEAESADEVAGVLGHEIAHVENRDVTRALIRHYGFSLLFTAMGGSTGGNIDALLSARYSREAEAQADADAITALKASNISPLPTARFFTRLSAGEEELGGVTAPLDYPSSHPQSKGRSKAFSDSAIKGHDYTPALTGEEWAALRNICAAPRLNA